MNEFKELLSNFLYSKGYEMLANNAGLILFLFALLVGSILPFIVKLVKYSYKFYLGKKAIKDLHPFFFPSEIKSATKFYIDTNCQNIPPSDYEELLSNHAFAVQEKLMPFFLKKVFKLKKDAENRFYFILSDSGMGKTTFLLNLYIKYSNEFRRSFEIKLLPLGSNKTDDELKAMKASEKRNTILLLDAFDEDIKASVDYEKRLRELVDLVWDFRVVIISSRTQFFDSELNEPNETGLSKFGGEKGHLMFQKIYISPFTDKDIRKYLRKKFSIINIKKRKKGFEIVKNCPNLMVRPMLLSYIEDLLSVKKKPKKATKIYEVLIEKWIERETKRVEIGKRYEFRTQLHKFSDELALDMYRNRKKRGGLHITSNEMETFAKCNGINLSILEMKSRSLLNRHSTGVYKFAHRSILEYFLALKLFEDKRILGDFDIKSFDQTYKFYLELFWDNLKSSKKEEALDLSHKLLYELDDSVDFRNIKYLALNNNYLSNILVLENCQSIIALQLSNNEIDSIKPLKKLINLQYLWLRGSKITNLEPLFALNGLLELDLTSNPLRNEQIEELKSYLPNTRIIFR